MLRDTLGPLSNAQITQVSSTFSINRFHCSMQLHLISVITLSAVTQPDVWPFEQEDNFQSTYYYCNFY